MIFYLIAMAQPPQGAGQQGSPFAAFMPLILIFIIFYFLLIKPQKKKQQETQKMLSGVQKGDKIITTGGIHGIVANVKDDVVSLKVAENVRIDVSRNCVATIKKEKAEVV